MWNRVGLGVVALVIICFTHWFRKWRDPKCNGVLPPGSMGFPLIGETLSLIIPSYSLDLHPFIKSRLQRYGPIFKTSIVGRPAVVSADPEFNNYIIQQEGKLVEIWYFDAISKLLVLDGESRINAAGIVHKYGKRSILSHIGVESIKESKACKSVAESLMSLPLNIPGTAYNKCLQDKKEIINMLREMLKQSRLSPNTNNRGDLLDEMIKDMDSEKFLTEDFIVQFLFGILFGSFETIPTVLALALKFVSENPSAVEELKAEQEAILKSRENPNSSLTWDECKSMTFTQQLYAEFTIPAGWSVMLVTSAKQLNPDTFKNPLEFNPWRWKKLDPFVISKNFMPFGGGQRQCVGAEYSKSFMVTFFHVLFTNFRWTVTKVGKIARDPILGLGEGIHINVSKKEN
ncbi:hypothetical protein UlMin_043127 [Ulmus minor]